MNRHNRLGWREEGIHFCISSSDTIAFVIFYLYPIVTVFVTSFCKWDYTNINAPEFFGIKNMWDNYKYIFHTYPYFWEALKNSSLWALLGVAIQIPIATLIALAFSRY